VVVTTVAVGDVVVLAIVVGVYMSGGATAASATVVKADPEAGTPDFTAVVVELVTEIKGNAAGVGAVVARSSPKLTIAVNRDRFAEPGDGADGNAAYFAVIISAVAGGVGVNKGSVEFVLAVTGDVADLGLVGTVGVDPNTGFISCCL
jgi:hypothetical protein